MKLYQIRKIAGDVNTHIYLTAHSDHEAQEIAAEKMRGISEHPADYTAEEVIPEPIDNHQADTSLTSEPHKKPGKWAMYRSWDAASKTGYHLAHSRDLYQGAVVYVGSGRSGIVHWYYGCYSPADILMRHLIY